MPPKRVSIAPNTKEGAKSAKANAKGTSQASKPNKNSLDKANPFKRASKDMKRAGDIRKQRNYYQNVIAEEREQKEREIRELQDKIVYYRRDNEKLLRQQKAKFGLKLDDLDVLKEDLDVARSTNDVLFQEVEARKEECDKLQHVMDNILNKINDVMVEKSDLNREKKYFEQEREKVARNEVKIHELVQSNKEMRAVLLQNKINPNSDASMIKAKTSSPRHFSDIDSKLPVIYDRQSLLSFRSEENLGPSKRKPRKGILRRTKSTSQGESVGAHGFLTRRTSESWSRRKSVDIYI